MTYRRQNPDVKPCQACGRTVHVGRWAVCRLCYRQASMLRGADGSLDLDNVGRHGQQLFIADLLGQRARTRADQRPAPPQPPPFPHGEQLVLFTCTPDLSAHGRAGLHHRAEPVLAAKLVQHAHEMAAEFGWSSRQIKDTCMGVRIVLGLRDSTADPVKASHVDQLKTLDLPVWTVLKVLAAAGLLEEDRTPALDAWFTSQLAGLPPAMTAEVTTWWEVMKHGSTTPPRRRPRSQTTITLHMRWATPTLRAWAAAGHQSLREIAREDVLDALPPSGNPRSQAGQGLKSIFRVLKGRKLLFTDPTVRVKTGYHESRQPLPVDVTALRAALHSANPAQAVLAALIAFHGVRSGQLQRLQLTDIRDGRLHLDGRQIVLAEPVRDRVRTYLDYRAQRWPRSTNPHLFLHYRTASRTDPVGYRWIRLTLGTSLSPAAIREDRILDEAQASDGDVRRLADLFGLSIQAGLRYTSTIEHPGLTQIAWPVPTSPA